MPQKRVAKDLTPLLNRRIAVYALAGAAGLTASATDANAAIVYTPVRRFAEAQLGRIASIPIDLNHDGLVDFNVKGLLRAESVTGISYQTAVVYADDGGTGDQLAASGSLSGPEAKALQFGEQIGARLRFEAPGVKVEMAAVLAFDGKPDPFGHFYNQTNKFLGLKFGSSGQAYYGWARVNVKALGNNNLVFELVDYAYQDTPNQPIRAGEGIPNPEAGSLSSGSDSTGAVSLTPHESGAVMPATLGLLACGSDAIPAWRSRN